jgi:nitrite reductase/ring-hydroxylating ferredoxin subunit
MAESLDKDFMNTQKQNSVVSLIISAFLITAMMTLSACTPDLPEDDIGVTQFDDLVLNLNLPTYQPLLVDGGYVYLNSIGARGVILYRRNSAEYLAFERNCPFQPSDACSTVDVHQSRLYMFDACCGSSFNFSDGQPTGGPAWRPMRQYYTSLSGSTLTVTDEILF